MILGESGRNKCEKSLYQDEKKETKRKTNEVGPKAAELCPTLISEKKISRGTGHDLAFQD